MENKYYTPSIEEFFVGFECETRVASFEENWEKTTIYAEFKDGWNSNIEDLLIAYNDGYLEFRVKYLDAGDIEELGFIYKGKTIDIWFEKEGNFDMGTWTSYKCRLHYGLHDNRLFIDMIDINDEISVFRGIVKNKSELKKVLNMLNIK